MNQKEQEAQFRAWVENHTAIIQRVVRAFARGADADDLHQEVLLALWHALPRFRAESRTSTFVYRVAHNTALVWLRREKRYRRRVDEADQLDWTKPATPDDTADAETQRRLTALYEALHELPPLDRSLMILSLEQLPYREIATIHGLTESNVGARLTRARQRLTTLMNPQPHNTENP